MCRAAAIAGLASPCSAYSTFSSPPVCATSKCCARLPSFDSGEVCALFRPPVVVRAGFLWVWCPCRHLYNEPPGIRWPHICVRCSPRKAAGHRVQHQPLRLDADAV
ncbi:hypothetical protein TRVL_09147 [Trypanosoma vivax]|nr:hypothetical protein TRVL_09147 [Trypanosoma vivax]